MNFDSLSYLMGCEFGGGGGEVPSLLIHDISDYAFFQDAGYQVMEALKGHISTNNITGASHMFSGNMSTEIPFDLNFKSPSGPINISYIFQPCSELVVAPRLNFADETIIGNAACFMMGSDHLKDFPIITGSYTCSNGTTGSAFEKLYQNCYSLRYLDENFDKKAWCKSSGSNSPYYYRYAGCYVLDEITCVPVQNLAAYTSNSFTYAFNKCHRVDRITFDEDYSGENPNWKAQTIDLSTYIGYADDPAHIYNCGIGMDKRVTNATTYAALKNDPDWWTTDVAFSRYNHDSAVETINSLPDCSAATATNTIKFTGASGSSTDGGAINTLTDAEIAVAAAKNWTVTLS